MKVCSKCQIEKDESEFSKKPDSKDGLQPKCKKCTNEYNVIYRQKMKFKKKEEIKNKKCGSCKETKDINCFGKNSCSNDGFSYVCKECRKKDYDKSAEKTKQYRTENLEEKKHYDKQYYIKNKNKKKIYYEENKDHKLEYNKEYYTENKELYLGYNREYRKKKKKDPCYRLRCNVSRRIYAALVENKKGSIFKYLPYAMKELKMHLENQFESWMSWDNYGQCKKNKRTWQIDHIIPQSKMLYDSMDHPNFRKCWALSNLRPLESLANLKKGNR